MMDDWCTKCKENTGGCSDSTGCDIFYQEIMEQQMDDEAELFR